MELNIMPQERDHMREYVRTHSIDHAYGDACEYLDRDVQAEQLLARDYQEFLDANSE